eukprot:6178918-Pleurochrysis_carterae.AAC.2
MRQRPPRHPSPQLLTVWLQECCLYVPSGTGRPVGSSLPYSHALTPYSHPARPPVSGHCAIALVALLRAKRVESAAESGLCVRANERCSCTVDDCGRGEGCNDPSGSHGRA